MKINELVVRIIEAADSYYNHSKLIISDKEFDSLVDELRSLMPDHPILTMTGWRSKGFPSLLT